jgi:hypothetical protein
MAEEATGFMTTGGGAAVAGGTGVVAPGSADGAVVATGGGLDEDDGTDEGEGDGGETGLPCVPSPGPQAIAIAARRLVPAAARTARRVSWYHRIFRNVRSLIGT